MNNHPHPRDESIKAYLKWLKSIENSHNRKNFKQRVSATVLDGYQNQTEYRELLKLTLMGVGGQNKVRVGADSGLTLRTRSMFALGHACIARGQFTRSVELADIGFMMRDDQGSGE